MPKILIIEDDETLRFAYATKLQMEGYDVDSAEDGAVGFKKAMADPPDVIILDMLMPNMTGVDFLEAFDVKGKHPDTKVIVFSNASIPETVNKALALGAKKYLTKSSFSPNQLVETIKELLAE